MFTPLSKIVEEKASPIGGKATPRLEVLYGGLFRPTPRNTIQSSGYVFGEW